MAKLTMKDETWQTECLWQWNLISFYFSCVYMWVLWIVSHLENHLNFPLKENTCKIFFYILYFLKISMIFLSFISSLLRIRDVKSFEKRQNFKWNETILFAFSNLHKHWKRDFHVVLFDVGFGKLESEIEKSTSEECDWARERESETRDNSDNLWQVNNPLFSIYWISAPQNFLNKFFFLWKFTKFFTSFSTHDADVSSAVSSIFKC